MKVFFKYRPDHEIERINDELERVIEDLSNSKDRLVIADLNAYPVLSVKAHTRPFEHRWLNIVSAAIIPLGLFFYFRMWRFRLRLNKDLKVILATNEAITQHINEISK